MFNGGSRKRAMAASLSNHHHHSSRENNNQQEFPSKRPRVASSSPETPQSVTPSTSLNDTTSPKTTPTNAGPAPYFPLIPMPNKMYSLPSPSFNGTSSPAAAAKSLATSHQQVADFRQSFAEFMWARKQPSLQIPYSCLMWPQPPVGPFFELSAADPSRTTLTFKASDPTADPFLFFHSQAENEKRWSQSDADEALLQRSHCSSSSSSNHTSSSAFKPVGKAANAKISSPLNATFPKCDSSNEYASHLDGRTDRSNLTGSASPGASCSQSDENDVDIIVDEDDSQSLPNKSILNKNHSSSFEDLDKLPSFKKLAKEDIQKGCSECGNEKEEKAEVKQVET